MERIYFRERAVLTGEENAAEPVWHLTPPEGKKKIAVVGISRGAGATFLAMSLAFLLSKNVDAAEEERKDDSKKIIRSHSMEKMVRERSWISAWGNPWESGTGREGGASGHGGRWGGEEEGDSPRSAADAAYVEMRRPAAGEPAAYFAAGLDLRFRGKRFTDFFSFCLQGQPLPRRSNLYRGINWVVWRNPAAAEETEHSDSPAGRRQTEDLERFPLKHFPLDQLGERWILVDSPPLDTLQQYDLVLGVIHPLPAQIFAGTPVYEILKDAAAAGLPVLWVVNGDHPEVNHSEMKRFLQLPSYCSIPLCDPSVFYRAQYGCRLPGECLADGRGSRPEGPDDADGKKGTFSALRELEKEIRKRLEK